MIKRKELKGPSCFTAAEKDEPLFVLRANDELAPEIVRRWASRYRKTKLKEKAKLAPAEIRRILDKYNEAMAIVIEMEDWRYEKRKLRQITIAG